MQVVDGRDAVQQNLVLHKQFRQLGPKEQRLTNGGSEKTLVLTVVTSPHSGLGIDQNPCALHCFACCSTLSSSPKNKSDPTPSESTGALRQRDLDSTRRKCRRAKRTCSPPSPCWISCTAPSSSGRARLRPTKFSSVGARRVRPRRVRPRIVRPRRVGPRRVGRNRLWPNRLWPKLRL